MIKSFCSECKHRNVNENLKMLFNENVSPTFIVCPVEGESNICGCFSKDLVIDWKGFDEFCSENGLKDLLNN